MAADVTDPAVLADSPAVLHGSVASCVEALQRRRAELGIDYVHFGGDPAGDVAQIECGQAFHAHDVPRGFEDLVARGLTTLGPAVSPIGGRFS